MQADDRVREAQYLPLCLIRDACRFVALSWDIHFWAISLERNKKRTSMPTISLEGIPNAETFENARRITPAKAGGFPRRHPVLSNALSSSRSSLARRRDQIVGPGTQSNNLLATALERGRSRETANKVNECLTRG
jgi:hypothetical protein